ncbi:LacI family DNA-binding transcriptional regulator [Nonomuraea sp. K274]|uniref:LacI family DNA-binding transcriptional regulator n=1 Tax=Nonomuraea cypriaca TaxID=1187855 RepID=A0A931F0A8_9ACTN|nr:LacI family DNA-binding transcriptional regulator [Nonomuraea cypriaca]MBF8186128.1 LacI family DNA-binding transcriptional regulator [Nonomuraea cypriaca]
MVTIYDVASRAGVSTATVSRVLNGASTVDPALASRVRAVVAELGYERNALARNLRLSSTKLWAVIISDIGNPFFTSLVRGVEDVAQEAGHSVVLCNSDEDAAKEAAYIKAALADRMAGVIISPSARAAGINQLVKSATPTVVIDRVVGTAPVDTVLVDNEHGAELATEHLITSGYRRVACVTGPRRLFTAARRLRGYRAALRRGGVDYDETLVRYADFREAGGREAMRSLLTEEHPPDAVFVANNLMTVGALDALVQADVRIPKDFGVVGFDDIPWAHLVRPSLTTVSQPTYDLGRAAARLLLERVRDPHRAPSTVKLKTRLQVRGSSTR